VSDYKLQIVTAQNDKVVSWRPGSKIETDIADELCVRLQGVGVGWFTSESKVLDAVRTEMAALIFDLKKKVR
jgi:hypothetical protein